MLNALIRYRREHRKQQPVGRNPQACLPDTLHGNRHKAADSAGTLNGSSSLGGGAMARSAPGGTDSYIHGRHHRRSHRHKDADENDTTPV